MQCAARHLTPTGRFFANVNVPEDTRPPGEWLEFPVVFKSYPFYEAAAATAGLETRWVGTLKELGHLSGNARQDQQVMLEFTLK